MRVRGDERTGAATDGRQPRGQDGRQQRTRLALAGLGCVALVVLLGFVVGPRSTDPDRDVKRVLREPLDQRPYRRAVRVLATETAWPHASYLMALAPLVLVGGLLAYDALVRRRHVGLGRWRWLLLGLAAVPLQHLLRVVFWRAGPNVPWWSEGARGAYPSGAALLVALGWVAGVVVAGDLRPRWRPLLLLAAAAALGLHAFARVAAQKHWASDIVGSYLLTAGVLLLAAAARR